VWRLTHFIAAEDGPWDILFKAKQKLKPGGFWYEFTKCFFCLSVWFGVGTALIGEGLSLHSVVYGVALSGGASLLQLISREK
jgi:hypothetical protein